MARSSRIATVTEARVLHALSQRFASPAYVFMQGVRNSTGYSGEVREADALAFSVWPSRGLELHGFEVKCSRNDWLRELKDPAKAEKIAKWCDRWWLVAPQGVLSGASELPSAWGFIEVIDGKTLRTVKEAPLQEHEPFTRGFIASLVRRAWESGQEGRPQDPDGVEALRAEYQRGLDDGLARVDDRIERLTAQHEKFRASVQAFEAASGVRITGHDGTHIGAAMAVVLSNMRRYGDWKTELQRAAATAENIATMCRSAADEMAALAHNRNVVEVESGTADAAAT